MNLSQEDSNKKISIEFENENEDKLKECLLFANAYAFISITKLGI